jgi:LPS-assembly lipoprotein
MHKRAKFTAVFSIFAAIVLTGCAGFKLRGCLTIPHFLKTVYITPCEPYHPFQREIRYRLKGADVQVVDHPGPNITTLELDKPEFNEQILAYSSSGPVQRSWVTYSVKYRLITKDGSDIDVTRTVSRRREISKSINAQLTNEIEEQIVRKELLNETVNELLRQITSPRLLYKSMPDSSTIDDSPC